jgi:ubiquinone/menaquinone biosynthesis C-methylase UbiE
MVEAEASRAFWERRASVYDRSMALFGGAVPEARRRVAELLRGQRRVLEVACGTGLFSEALAPGVGELLATDGAAAMVDLARRRLAPWPHVRVEQRELLALGEPSHSADALLAANVLHLLPDLPQALAALVVPLRPGGLLLIPTYCHAQHLRSRLVSAALSLISFPGQRRFDLAGLRQVALEAGLQVEVAELIPALLPIGLVVARKPMRPTDAG